MSASEEDVKCKAKCLKFMKLKRELKNRVRLRRARILKKTSRDRSLEKSILSKSDTSLSSSILKQGVLLALNKSLADNVQRSRIEIRAMQDQLYEYEIQNCQLRLELSGLKQLNDKLKRKCKNLKSNCDKRSAWETWKAEFKSKCKELMELTDYMLDQNTSYRSSISISSDEGEYSEESDLANSSDAAALTDLDSEKSEEISESASVTNEKEKEPLRTIFNMTAISEENLYTPNVSFNASSSLKENSSLDEHKDLPNTYETVTDEANKRRDTYTVANPVQNLEMLTPHRLRKAGVNFVQQSEVTSMKECVSAIMFQRPKCLERTILDIEDMEFTVSLDMPIVTESKIHAMGLPSNHVEILSSNANVANVFSKPLIIPKHRVKPHEHLTPERRSEQLKVPNSPSKLLEVSNHSSEQLEVSNHSSEQLEVSNHSSEQLEVSNHSSEQLEVSNSPCKQLEVPNSPCKQLEVPNSPCKQLEVPNSPCKQLEVPNSPCKQLEVPNSPSKLLKVSNCSSEQLEVSSSPSKLLEISNRNSDLQEVPKPHSKPLGVSNCNSEQQRITKSERLRINSLDPKLVNNSSVGEPVASCSKSNVEHIENISSTSLSIKPRRNISNKIRKSKPRLEPVNTSTAVKPKSLTGELEAVVTRSSRNRKLVDYSEPNLLKKLRRE